MLNIKHNIKTLTILAASVAMTACVNIGRPEFTPIHQQLTQSVQKPLVPTPVVIAKQKASAPGSLFQKGSKGFFKDSRAAEIGDIVTVMVKETASAETEANTETNRKTVATAGLSNLLNLAGTFAESGFAPGTSNLLDTNSNRDFEGEGKTDREDKLEAKIAAVVTQKLPNGYLVIQGKREVMINYEMQELNLQGIIRPVDINPDNTISSEKIAEARISYAGKGLIDKAQQPSYGVQFFEEVSPF